MVSSSYTNWETDAPIVNSVPIHQTRTVEVDHLAAADNLEYYWDPFNQLHFAFMDPYIHLNNSFLQPENDSPYDPLIPLPPETIPNETFRSYSFPKRQKFVEDRCLMPADFFDGHGVSCPVLEDHHHQVQTMNNGIHSEGAKASVGKNSAEKCVSVQSIAARERRRKITKKTQELGKLVPGGSKMNTAEMLQAAFNYVKYLQAQLGILQLIDSFQENKEGDCRKEKVKMEIVTSPKVQEKLYMKEKCLVPKDFVLSLTTISRPPLSDELACLLSSP